jgi:threonyl-tRNA synthetase
VQAVVIPVAERHQDYGRAVADRLRGQGVRVTVDDRSEKMGYKIREAQVQKIPYMLVVGDKEIEAKNVALRHRQAGDLGGADVDALAARIARLAAERALHEETPPSSGGVS